MAFAVLEAEAGVELVVALLMSLDFHQMAGLSSRGGQLSRRRSLHNHADEKDIELTYRIQKALTH